MSDEANKKRRRVRDSYVVAPPARVSTRTRIRPSAADAKVLEAMGAWYNKEFLWAFKQRNALGTSFTKQDRAALKRELTARGMSSRWASAILGEAMRTWRSRRANTRKHMQSLRLRAARISERLAANSNDPYPAKLVVTKTRRLAKLTATLRREEKQYATGQVSFVLGGHKLANRRHHVDDVDAWRQAWDAARTKTFAAAGEAGKNGGNETIRIVNQCLEMKLPAALSYLANIAHNRYRFATPIAFAHRAAEVAAATQMRQAVAYRVFFGAAKQRWYLTATIAAMPGINEARVAAARANGAVGLDLNADHVAVATVDASGNLVAPPEFHALNKGPAGQRDAAIRAALTAALRIAQERKCLVAVEDLDFEDSKELGREANTKAFRAMLHGFPTTNFRGRARCMANTAKVSLVAVDPAYTSVDAQQWVDAMHTTIHGAAAAMIARRALDLPLRRRGHNPRTDQRIEASRPDLQSWAEREQKSRRRGGKNGDSLSRKRAGPAVGPIAPPADVNLNSEPRPFGPGGVSQKDTF